uniref:Secreted protein n=1 Tax=Triticum urartu TaxID=4572 RepID=A0A8R7PQY4_TRIUA
PWCGWGGLLGRSCAALLLLSWIWVTEARSGREGGCFVLGLGKRGCCCGVGGGAGREGLGSWRYEPTTARRERVGRGVVDSWSLCWICGGCMCGGVAG